MVQMVKNLPEMQEIRVLSLGWEDPLEKGVATHSSILAWRIPWTEESGRLKSLGLQRVGHELITEQQQSTAWCHTEASERLFSKLSSSLRGACHALNQSQKNKI